MRKPDRWAGCWFGLCLSASSGCRESLPAPPVTNEPPAVTPSLPHVAYPAPTDSSVSAARERNTSPAQRDAASGALRYERLTLGGAAADAPLPWVVAFHGLGDDPKGFARLFDRLPFRAHVYLARAPLPYGTGFDWFGERVTGDPERLALALQRRVGDVTTLLDTLAAQPQNRGQAVVTGFSQGGVLSFGIAVAGLRHVRAALPLAGWLPPSLAASGPVVPTYAFHGEQDQVVPFAATRHMLDSWQRAGVEMEYRTYPGVAHTISADMRREWAARLGELLR